MSVPKAITLMIRLTGVSRVKLIAKFALQLIPAADAIHRLCFTCRIVSLIVHLQHLKLLETDTDIVITVLPIAIDVLIRIIVNNVSMPLF